MTAFLSRLRSGLAHVKQYEDPLLQDKARSLVPIDLLAKNRSKADERDSLLLELLSWFKRDFFRWCDSPKCDFCNAKTLPRGMGPPNEQELRHQASRVELYACTTCGRETRFPRYNDPAILLETRRGRCGEWANCFAFICRALDYEVRHVLDWTDHVWVEVYSEAQQRWLHCDPCENKCNKPLMYEAGWGKKLSYIIAFSKDDVIVVAIIADVTWRYSAKHEEVRSRRKECSEEWFARTIHHLNQQIQSRLPGDRVAVLQQRTVKELTGFLTVRSADGDELQGRESGSEAWRRERGELGKESIRSTKSQVGYVFTPSQDELTNGLMAVCYSPVHDAYYRCMSDDILPETAPYIRSWREGLFDYTDVFRKEESDWEKVYLSRVEGTDVGEIGWKFDLGVSISCALLKCSSTTYENGKVEWSIRTSDGKDVSVPLGGSDASEVTELQGKKTFELRARLLGGRGDVAWQHSQLFRMPLGHKSDFPFEITLIFEDSGA